MALDRQDKSDVLIVEDDQTIRETLRLALELEGYVVNEASNGKEAIDILAQHPLPKLILLDLMMPIMDGWKFIESIQKDSVLSQIPIIVISAFSDKAQFTSHIRATIKKPVDFDRLMELVQHYCGSQSNIQVG